MKNVHIFDNISQKELDHMIVCFKAQIKKFPSGSGICLDASNVSQIGVLLSGEADLVKYDYDGYRNIIEHLGEQDLFGHIFVQPFDENGIEIVTSTDCQILWFDYDYLIRRCEKACLHHSLLVNNVLQIFSAKTRKLHSRIEVLSQRSIRNKLLTYFHHQAYKNHSTSFTLPFTLNSMADYLFIDRSAMIREMKKMREEGIIESKGRKITLKSDT